MRRPIAFLLGLSLAPLLVTAPPAHAFGAGPCLISGTIDFSPPSQTAATGTWTIGTAVINCQGPFSGYYRFSGPGPFAGSGTYTAFPPGSGACLPQVGKGTVDYLLQTTSMDLHIVESQEFVAVGVGKFTTPSLHGTLQWTPPYDGDCVTKPVTKASFVAEALITRLTPFAKGPRR